MKKYLAILVFFIVLLPLSSLEISRGNLKLVLNESLGTYSVYDITNRSKPVSLLVDADTRTSSLSLLMGDRVYRLNRSTSSLKLSVEETENGAAFVWTGSFVKVTETFTFISSGAGAEDGLKIELKIENLSSSTAKIGVRIVMDTYLGEDGGGHFLLGGSQSISREVSLSGNFDSHWVSGDPEEGTALQVMIDSPGNTIPEKVVFANWKRLDSANWDYNSRDRNFNYQPYSINDSAVSYWYDVENLQKDQSRIITLYMGLYSEEGFSSRQTSASPTVVRDTSGGSGNSTDAGTGAAQKDVSLITDLHDNLAEINEILKMIEEAIAGEGELGAETLSVIELSVQELEENYRKYQD